MAFDLIGDSSDLRNVVGDVNKVILDLKSQEQTRVTRRAQGDNAIVEGRLPNEIGYGELLYDTNGSPRILMAIGSDNEPIFKISQSGIDVTTAASTDLVFDSSRVAVQIISSGTFTISGGTVSSASFLSRDTTVSYDPQSTRPIVLAFHTTSAALGQLWSGMIPTQWTTSSSSVTITRMELFTMDVGLSSTTFTNRTDNGTAISVAANTWSARYFVLNQFQS